MGHPRIRQQRMQEAQGVVGLGLAIALDETSSGKGGGGVHIQKGQLNLTRALALDGPPADRKTISKKARTVADARRTVEQNDRLNLLAGAPDSFPLTQ